MRKLFYASGYLLPLLFLLLLSCTDSGTNTTPAEEQPGPPRVIYMTGTGSGMSVTERAVYTISPDSLKREKVVDIPAQFTVDLPVLSPDGKKVFCKSQNSFWIGDLKTRSGREYPLNSGDKFSLGGFWSPNGKHLIFQTSGNQSPKVWLFDVTAQTTAPFEITGGAVVFSHDGTHIFTVTSSAVSMKDLSGKTVRTFTYNNDGNSEEIQALISSPARNEIAFVRRGEPNKTLLVNMDDTTVTTLKSGARFFPCHFSGDGSQVLLYEEGNPPYQISTINKDGSGFTVLTPSTMTEKKYPWFYPPKWSPDGSMIAFGTLPAQQWRLNIIRADGSNARTIETTNAFGDVFLGWSRIK